MQTVKDWIKAPYGGDVWFHGLDVLGHILRADQQEGLAYPRGGSCRENDPSYLKELRSGIEQYQRDKELDDMAEAVFSKPRRRTRHVQAPDGDDVNVLAYIDKDPKRLFDRAMREEARQKPAINIVMEGNVPYIQRKGQDMRLRQIDAYDLVLRAEAEGRPCRVIVALESRYDDRLSEFTSNRGPGVLRLHIVVKDWNERIFPSLWGCFKDNETANAFMNCFTAFILGGDPSGNGNVRFFTMDSLPEGEECVIVGHENKNFMAPGPSCEIYQRKS